MASLSTFRQPSHPPVYHCDHDDNDNSDDDSDDGCDDYGVDGDDDYGDNSDDNDSGDDDNNSNDDDDDSSPTQSWNASRSAAGSFFLWITFKSASFHLTIVMIIFRLICFQLTMHNVHIVQ